MTLVAIKRILPRFREDLITLKTPSRAKLPLLKADLTIGMKGPIDKKDQVIERTKRLMTDLGTSLTINDLATEVALALDASLFKGQFSGQLGA